jgi:hypothetical protein
MEHTKMKFSKRTILLITLLFIALFSFFVISKVVITQDFNAATIKSLDDKKQIVMGLALTSASASTFISAASGKVAMPIANQFAELSSYFVFILGVIIFEKMLMAITGFLSFAVIIPAACFLGILHLFINKMVLRNLAIKLAILGIAIFIAIPSSVLASDLIYGSYTASIAQTAETAKHIEVNSIVEKEVISTEEKNLFEKIGSVFSKGASKIGKAVASTIEKGKDTLNGQLNGLLDTVALMIVTTCVIPIMVILFLAWIVKILFDFDVGVSTFIQKRLSKRQPDNQIRQEQL